VLIAFAAVLVLVVGIAVAVRAFGDKNQHAATRPRLDPVTDRGCTLRFTASPAVRCVTAYDAKHISFRISGFKAGTKFQASTRDGQNAGSSATNSSGTNVGRSATRARRAAADPGTTVGATQPIFGTGAVVTGTAANGASVTFFVPTPSAVGSRRTSDRSEVTPVLVSVVDSTHLELGLPCNAYGPAVQIKETPRTVRVGAFYDRTEAPQDDCRTLVVVGLPSAIGTRTIASDVDGARLSTNADCANTSTSVSVTVPDVIGRPLADAIAAVEAAGVKVIGYGTPPGDPTGDSAIVTAQEPKGVVPAGACIGFRTTASHQ
jgi:hypothetical protein